MKIMFSLFALLLILTVLAVPAQAHKALFFAYMEGGDLVCEGGFPGGKVCKKCPIKIYDAASGEAILDGNTDEQGIWRTSLPDAASKATKGLKIILVGGEGHQAEWLLEPEEFLDAVKEAPAAPAPAVPAPAVAKPVAPSPASVAAPAATPQVASPSDGAVSSPAVSASDLEALMQQAVEQGLEKKLGPVRKQLAQALDPGPSFTSILGGLGWIIGLAGLVAWMRSRKA